MSETASERIYRTVDGELVDGTDERAAFLAYAEGDELTTADAKAWKERKPAPNKQRRAPSTKGTTKKPAGDGALPPKTAGDPGGGTAGPDNDDDGKSDDDGGQAADDAGTGSGLKIEGGAPAGTGDDPTW